MQDDDTAEGGFTLMLPFDRDSADFARGVEVGMIWARLASEPPPVRAVAHVDNAEMLLRMGEAWNLRTTATELSLDWLGVTFS